MSWPSPPAAMAAHGAGFRFHESRTTEAGCLVTMKK
jgi:hypothetical protein